MNEEDKMVERYMQGIRNEEVIRLLLRMDGGNPDGAGAQFLRLQEKVFRFGLRKGREMAMCELGIRIGMDDYVTPADSTYWSVDNVQRHVMWLEERARGATGP